MALEVGASHRIAFGHGLGDAVMLTSLLRQLRWHDPGCRIELTVAPYRAALFAGLADEIVPATHFFNEPKHSRRLSWPLCEMSYADSPSTNTELCLREQFGLIPAPEAWGYCVQVDQEKRRQAVDWLASIPRKRPKTAILHYRGITGKEDKDLDDYQAAAICRELDARGYDTLIWDANHRSPLPEVGIGQRIEEGPPLFDSRPGDCGMLAGLLAAVDLVVGVDSGILHLASAVGTRAIGCWVKHHPVHFFAPDETTVHAVPKKDWVDSHRWLVKQPIDTGIAFFEANYQHRYSWDVVETIAELLEGLAGCAATTWLDSPEHDFRLKSWLAKTGPWQRKGWDGLPTMTVDRHKGFAILLEHLRGCERPTVIETGTTRAANDFGGAGSATSLFGLWVQQRGGMVISVDLSERNCDFARSWLREFRPHIYIHQGHSVGWLDAHAAAGKKADLVYLDSMDIEMPEHAAHCLEEAQAAAPLVKSGGLIAIDDTPEVGGRLHGKGALAAPWLESQGWRIVHAGYQRVLRKP